MNEFTEIPQDIKSLLTNKEKSPFPEMKDSEDMVNVEMNTWGISSANQENPVVKTIGLGPCVAVVLYEPESKVGGMVHMTAPGLAPRWKGPHQDILNMLTVMQRNGVEVSARDTMQAHIVGGWEHDDLASLAKGRLEQLGIKSIVSDVRTEGVTSHCIALDTKDGSVYSLTEILPGSMSELDAMRAMIKTNDGAGMTSDTRSMK